jgi:hypothetical protein
MTPETVQGAAFEKNSSSDSGPIMQRKSFDVINRSGHGKINKLSTKVDYFWKSP